MRIILLILFSIVLLFGLALLLMWLPLPQPFPSPLSGGRNLLAAVITGIVGLAYLAGLVVYLVSAVRQAGQVLDPAFAAKGLTARSYLGVGRQYEGTLRGRRVRVEFMPPRVLERSLLNIYVSADLGSRAAIGAQKPLFDCRDCPRVDFEASALRPLQVYAEDEAWVRRLLSEPANGALVSRLIRARKGEGLWQIYLQPERIWLRARPSARVTGDAILEALDDLGALAGATEATH